MASEPNDKVIKYIYDRLHLDNCLLNSSHPVRLTSNDSKVYYCDICEACFGLDDGSSTEDILKYAKYTRETCTGCGNNNPNRLYLEISEGTCNITCLECKAEIKFDFNDFDKYSKQFSMDYDYVEENSDHSSNSFECLRCGSIECSVKDKDGKLQEVKCTGCDETFYYNEALLKFRAGRRQSAGKYQKDSKSEKEGSFKGEQTSASNKFSWKTAWNFGLKIISIICTILSHLPFPWAKTAKYIGTGTHFLQLAV